MSKLIDRLDKVGTIAPAPMGFGTNRSVEKHPPLFLIAIVDPKSRNLELQSKVDSYIVVSSKGSKSDIRAAKKIASGAIWGIYPSTLDYHSLEEIKKQGGDFFVCSTTNTPAEILAVDNMGRLINIPANFPEELSHSIEEIPVDGVLLSGLEDKSPLLLTDLMQIRSVRDIISKPILLLRSANLNHGELSVLQEVGIQGIVADSRIMNAESISNMYEHIQTLSPRKIKRDQADAILPTVLGRSEITEEDGEEDDD